MIAKNYRQFPDALIAQRELELVHGVAGDVSEADLCLIKKSWIAAGIWIRQYATKAVKTAAQVPAWLAAMQRRAKALAKAVKEAIWQLWSA